MATDSSMTDPIITAFRQAKRPLTASEIAEAVGITRQGAYYWLLRTGSEMVEAVGTGRHSATAYVLRDDVVRFAPRFRPRAVFENANGTKPDVKLGATFTVIALKVDDDGSVIMSLRDDTGATMNVTVPA